LHFKFEFATLLLNLIPPATPIPDVAAVRQILTFPFIVPNSPSKATCPASNPVLAATATAPTTSALPSQVSIANPVNAPATAPKCSHLYIIPATTCY